MHGNDIDDDSVTAESPELMETAEEAEGQEREEEGEEAAEAMARMAAAVGATAPTIPPAGKASNNGPASFPGWAPRAAMAAAHPPPRPQARAALPPRPRREETAGNSQTATAGTTTSGPLKILKFCKCVELASEVANQKIFENERNHEWSKPVTKRAPLPHNFRQNWKQAGNFFWKKYFGLPRPYEKN